jgi:hypothetical protein
MTERKTYLAEDVFEDIPGDPDNVIFKIPPEICDQAGLQDGDTVVIEVDEQNGSLTIRKSTDKDNEQT